MNCSEIEEPSKFVISGYQFLKRTFELSLVLKKNRTKNSSSSYKHCYPFF